MWDGRQLRRPEVHLGDGPASLANVPDWNVRLHIYPVEGPSVSLRAGRFLIAETLISFGSSRPCICFMVLSCINRLIAPVDHRIHPFDAVQCVSNSSRSRTFMNSLACSWRGFDFQADMPSAIVGPIFGVITGPRMASHGGSCCCRADRGKRAPPPPAPRWWLPQIQERTSEDYQRPGCTRCPRGPIAAAVGLRSAHNIRGAVCANANPEGFRPRYSSVLPGGAKFLVQGVARAPRSPGTVPEHQLDPVGTLRPEHVDRPGERIRRHRLAHQCCQSLGTLAEVDRFGRHHHADRAGRADHVPAFNARSTAVTVFASAPRPTRTVTPSISTSIIPAPGSTWRRGILR